MSFFKNIFYKTFLNKRICPFCANVYSNKNDLCPKCTSIIQIANKQEFCRKCGNFIINKYDKNNTLRVKPISKDETVQICQSCKNTEQYYDLARGVTLYEGIVKDNIYKFKYHGQRSLASIMAKLMVEKALAYSEYWDIDCVVPVPIAKEKLVVRRYNQAYLLAKEISKIMNIPIITNNLIRVVNTPAQSKLGKLAREENLYQAFQVVKGKDFIGKKVLLVDDILTTGSTVNECSRIMKEKGASVVVVLTLVTGRTLWNGGKKNGYSEL